MQRTFGGERLATGSGSGNARLDSSIVNYVWRLVEATVRHDILTWAAVIAFYGLFSLFPLLMLMLYVAALLLPGTDMEHMLVLIVKPYFPALDSAQNFITSNINHLAEAGPKVGIVSLITLVWSAGSAFIALQQALDVIWNVHRQRSYFGRRIMAFGMLLVLLLITLGSAIFMGLYSTTTSPSSGFPLWVSVWLHHMQWLHGASRVLFPGSLFLGCIVIYRYMPTKTAPWSYLFPGALVAAVSLDLGRQLFVWYAGHMVTYQILYGGVFTVMLVILWMYIGATMMLFGAEISATLEAWATEHPASTDDDAITIE